MSVLRFVFVIFWFRFWVLGFGVLLIRILLVVSGFVISVWWICSCLLSLRLVASGSLHWGFDVSCNL